MLVPVLGPGPGPGPVLFLVPALELTHLTSCVWFLQLLPFLSLTDTLLQVLKIFALLLSFINVVPTGSKFSESPLHDAKSSQHDSISSQHDGVVIFPRSDRALTAGLADRHNSVCALCSEECSKCKCKC